MPTIDTLILPGLFNSGPEHWQSYWERSDPSCRRVEQTDWVAPHCADWVAALDAAIAAARGPVVLVAHSASCAVVAHWAAAASRGQLARVRGALLVAPSDPAGPSYPAGPTGFAPVPTAPLPFRSIVVASTNDEFVTLERAAEYASAWGSELVDVGAAGHINSASGLGAWPQGRALLDRLRATASASHCLAHVAVVVRDYDEAIAFYTKVLGFTLVEDSPREGAKRWVVVAPQGSDGATLLLARAATPEQSARVGDQTGGRVFLFLHTDDFHRDFSVFKSRGVRFIEEPRHEEYGTVAVFLDLYGNRWDLIQPHDA